MRYVSLCLILAACGGSPAPAPSPSYAAVETVTVHANGSETVRRLVAIYTADAIQVANTEGATITTAPVQSVALSAGSGRSGATGTADYFYRATVAGDSVSTVTLAMWGRLTTRSGSDPESSREVPIAASCASDPKCSPYLERMKRHADALRDHR